MHDSLIISSSSISFWYNKQLIAHLVGRHEDLFNPENSCLPRATWIFCVEQIFMSPSQLGNKCIVSVRDNLNHTIWYSCCSDLGLFPENIITISIANRVVDLDLQHFQFQGQLRICVNVLHLEHFRFPCKFPVSRSNVFLILSTERPWRLDL